MWVLIRLLVLIDTGISRKRIVDGLHEIDRKPEELKGILITHEHSDHIKGLGVMSRKYHIPIYATAGTIDGIRNSTSLGQIDEDLFHTIRADGKFQIEDLEVEPFAISHDAAEPVAYRLDNGEKSVAVVTDLGYYDEKIVSHLKDLDGVLLESNHDIHMLQVGSYPYYLKQRILGNRGHLSNENAGRLLCEILNDRIKTILLGHLSRENNYEALAYETVCAEVTLGDNPYKAGDFPICSGSEGSYITCSMPFKGRAGVCISDRKEDKMKRTVITVVGKDTVGIIAKVCTYLAEHNVNILDISQTIVQGFFNMMMITDANQSENHLQIWQKGWKSLEMRWD